MPPHATKARRAYLAPLRLLRFLLVPTLMALARALGGRPPELKPEPRNRATEVERKR